MIKSRILIVEDEVIVSKYIEACLSNLGYEIAAVITSGEEAVQNTEIINPDLILMDVRLSGKMNGTEAAAQISQKMDVPIVFLTAYTDEKTIDMAKDSDPYGYLVKPFYEKELQTTLEMALHKHEKFRLLKKERDLFYSIIENKNTTDSIFIRTNNRLKRVKYDEICYVEALRDYITINTSAENFTVRINMKEIQKILPEKDFVRIHKSFIVRMDKIFSIKYTSLIIEGSMKELPVGNFYRKDLYGRLNML
ncbi:MAG: response regulator [Bacteroidales bacterium]|jgi:DNA-binding LytR/AlgR family response regulator|nr:response regulator [Bacteroidales bacterium]MDD4213212.1 response regulator [Bacteroidales bacterium]